MSRVTLVLNLHDAASETFQRSLVQALTGGGHEVTVHALRYDGTAASSVGDPGRSWALPPASDRVAAMGRVLRSGPRRELAALLAEAVRRWGRGRRAATAAWDAAPILATRPDVIHVGFSGIGIAMQDALDLLAPIPVVVSCRGTDELVRPVLDPARPEQLRALGERATVVHAVADAIAETVIGFGIDRAKVRVVRPAVDTERWRPMPDGERTAARAVTADATASEERPEAPSGTLEIVAVARLVPAKGLDDLISALAATVDDGIDAHLRVIGAGPHRGALVLRAERTGMADRVRFVGAMEPDAVRAEVGAADVFVCPSLSEGISNVVLEAMALGVAVVSTNVGGMAEVIRHGTDGLLVPSGRPELLAAAISDLARDPVRRARIAAAGRSRVEGAFGLGQQFEAWLAVYDGLPQREDGSVRAPWSEGKTT